LPSVFEAAASAYPDGRGNYAMPQHCTRAVLLASVQEHEAQIAGHQASRDAELAMIQELDRLGVPEDMSFTEWRKSQAGAE
jgi:5-enolpyruvylshikimate-3-phosphate synthase